jgi:hypothetical protein
VTARHSPTSRRVATMIIKRAEIGSLTRLHRLNGKCALAALWYFRICNTTQKLQFAGLRKRKSSPRHSTAVYLTHWRCHSRYRYHSGGTAGACGSAAVVDQIVKSRAKAVGQIKHTGASSDAGSIPESHRNGLHHIGLHGRIWTLKYNS